MSFFSYFCAFSTNGFFFFGNFSSPRSVRWRPNELFCCAPHCLVFSSLPLIPLRLSWESAGGLFYSHGAISCGTLFVVQPVHILLSVFTPFFLFDFFSICSWCKDCSMADGFSFRRCA